MSNRSKNLFGANSCKNPDKNRQALVITVSGTVQGVGFRPFVYRLAKEMGLCGQVANTSLGVRIEAQGHKDCLKAFVRRVKAEAPPLARIERIKTKKIPLSGLSSFSVKPSLAPSPARTGLPPDVAVCDFCLAQVCDSDDRRFGYPFTNCTQCGPRFTIALGLPYDRAATSMQGFAMCPECLAEYCNPNDRRFHAQPNACPQCGPMVSLFTADKEAVKTKDPVGEAARLIKNGAIVAIKGLGGFHLCCDAANPQAVGLLRKRKARPAKPFAVMCADLEAARAVALFSVTEDALLKSPARPAVLAKKRAGSPLAGQVAPGLSHVAVMLAYTPLHHLLVKDFSALVMTSGNISNQPICTKNTEAFDCLSGVADFFLVHNRPIVAACDDSVMRASGRRPIFLRRSRGFVPAPVFLRQRVLPVLACGAWLKNTVCLADGDKAFLSQHIGGLESLESRRFFLDVIAHLEKITQIQPEIAACDLLAGHPGLEYAGGRGLPVFRIGHHHAHIASCMAENRFCGPVIGICADGAGLGPDNTVWGGETLLADFISCKRLAHLEPVALPGGDAAARQPWRMALSHLANAFGENAPQAPALAAIPKEHINIVCKMIKRGINSPVTTSLGRLFDAVAALCGICLESAHEGHAAMLLESIAHQKERQTYEILSKDTSPKIIPAGQIVRAVVADIHSKVPASIISARFHNTVARVFTQSCLYWSKKTGVKTAALSGGVFQNALLLRQMIRLLKEGGMEKVLIHRLVPTGDGGISLGQAAVAAALAKEGKAKGA
jgi:hydrogenase maturation protein HypF